MSEENDQITRNNHIVDIWNDINSEIHDIQKEGNLNNIADRAAAIIRVLRQGIERLRHVVGESDTDEPPRSLTDMNKLKKDELAFVAWQFWEWYNENECPIDKCHDYFCRHCQLRKDEADEELADGSLSQEEYNIMAKDKFHDDMCDDMQTGCWVQYYLWCYRNGYDPQTGKKSK